MLKIIPIQAIRDNYIWTIYDSNSKQAIVLDPGEAQPAIQELSRLSLSLSAILITHHHFDHTDGIASLLNRWNVPVYGANNSPIEYITNKISEGDTLDLMPNLQLKVLEIPGHTLDHVAYYGNNMLFCGDTLFAGGCGGIFEGTAEQMWNSLKKIAKLPQKTLIYCAHEYTEKNLKFASQIEPNNNDLKQRIMKTKELRTQKLPTIPSTLKLELKTNPFLRINNPSIIKTIEKHYKNNNFSAIELFERLRSWKNGF